MLWLLLLALSPLKLVNASVSPLFAKDAQKGVRILGSLTSDATVCLSPLSSTVYQQEIENFNRLFYEFERKYLHASETQSCKRKFNQISSTVEQSIGFWLTVENFLKMILFQLSRNFNLSSKMSEQNASSLHRIINECLNRIPKQVSSESEQLNADVSHRVQIAQVSKGLIVFRHLIYTAYFFFQPVLSTPLYFYYLNMLATQFGFLERAFRPEGEPFSAYLNNHLMIHYRNCCWSFIQQIEANNIDCLILREMPDSISTKIEKIKVWMGELKSHALQTTEQKDITATLSSVIVFAANLHR